ncbi:hypothetical protein CFLV_10000 [Corynebacterium flavescens]|uniref:Uncharacterized protein n=1 Tax=Corynebacterium flavescens TaxID=28028 RepID=A0A1L7CNP2_CORFL|nr:hypothetical protein CFLV_10000 [Corynebacterium flavescens]
MLAQSLTATNFDGVFYGDNTAHSLTMRIDAFDGVDRSKTTSSLVDRRDGNTQRIRNVMNTMGLQ